MQCCKGQERYSPLAQTARSAVYCGSVEGRRGEGYDGGNEYEGGINGPDYGTEMTDVRVSCCYRGVLRRTMSAAVKGGIAEWYTTYKSVYCGSHISVGHSG